MSSFRGSGDIGVPKGVKTGGKVVNFKSLNSDNATDFDLQIEALCPRFAWARASLCPCQGFNEQTNQPDPKCPLCNAIGFSFTKPHAYVVDSKAIGDLTETQCAMIENANAVVIKCLMVNAGSQPDLYNILGAFTLGSASCTVRHGNRLGYLDRLIALDDEMIHSEVVETDGTGRLKLKYPCIALNTMRSVATVFTEDDVSLDAGDVVWTSGSEPAAGTRVSVNYVCHPVWTVMEHTKLNRTTLIKQKKSSTTTPVGDIVKLPPQVLVRLEHLPMNTSD